MIKCSIRNAKKEFDKLAANCIYSNDVYNIKTNKGSVVLISENNYKNMIESLYLARIKGIYKDIKETINTPTEDFIKDSPIK